MQCDILISLDSMIKIPVEDACKRKQSGLNCHVKLCQTINIHLKNIQVLGNTLRATNAGQEAVLESMSEELGVIAKIANINEQSICRS